MKKITKKEKKDRRNKNYSSKPKDFLSKSAFTNPSLYNLPVVKSLMTTSAGANIPLSIL